MGIGFVGWPPEAVGVVEAGVARHGGWALWERLRAISLVPASLRGLLPWLKGSGRTFALPARVEILPHEGRATFHDYPTPGLRGVLDRGHVRIEEADVGAVRAASADHRRTFGWLRRVRRWTPLDALYFFGYALTNYHAFPFVLPRASFAGWRTWRRRGGAVRGLALDLPPDLPTHSRRQTFFFDDSGLLVRHDYVADIVGGWARGAHFWDAYAEVGGLMLATHRRVLARVGTTALPLLALEAHLEGFELRLDP